jgi:hypothetical protein
MAQQEVAPHNLAHSGASHNKKVRFAAWAVRTSPE